MLTVLKNILIAALSPLLVKITDFGISKHWADTSLRTHCGTLCYQAPEQLGLLPRDWFKRGNSYTDAIDLWALGAIVHQMLTSEIPFRDTYQPSFLSEFDLSSSNTNSPTLDMGLIVDYCRAAKPFPTGSLLNKRVNRNGIEFVTSVMAANPRDRLTAVAALKCVWFDVTSSAPPSVFLVPLFRWCCSSVY